MEHRGHCRNVTVDIFHYKMNSIVKDHFLNPRNMGSLENPTSRSIVRSESCNDIVKLTADIDGGIIREMKSEVFGCGYSIAGASITTEKSIGKKVEMVVEELGAELDELLADIPEKHHTCMRLGLRAVKALVDPVEREE
jgi:nitrogen fixation protein NifU and related proteins